MSFSKFRASLRANTIDDDCVSPQLLKGSALALHCSVRVVLDQILPVRGMDR
jgi:hypothetical protein